MSTKALENALGTEAAEPAPPTIMERLDGLGPELEKAIPQAAGYSVERIIRLTLTIYRTTRNMDRCSWQSLAGGVMTAAQLGLEFGPLGHCYIIPRWNNRLKGYEASFMLGYPGIAELARRSGRVGSLQFGWVFPGDDLVERYGSEPRLDVTPKRPRPTDVLPSQYWACVQRLDGGHDSFDVMDRSAAEEHRDLYAPRNKNKEITGPWVSNFDVMAAVSVFRKMKNRLPLSVEMAAAFNMDGQVITDTTSQVIDIEPLEPLCTDPTLEVVAVESKATDTGDAIEEDGWTADDAAIEVGRVTGDQISEWCARNDAPTPDGTKAQTIAHLANWHGSTPAQIVNLILSDLDT